MKKKIALLAALAMLLGLFAGCGNKSGEKADDYVVQIGYDKALCMVPIHIAIEKGFFEAEGLKYEATYYSSDASLEAAGTGKVDASFGLVGKLVNPITNGLGLYVTAGVHTGCIKVLVKTDSGIASVADLKGKKIGVAALVGSPSIMLQRALQAAGIGVTADSPDAAELIVYPAADLANALDKGAVDAIAHNDPSISVAERDFGLKVILDTATDEQFSDEYCCVSFVTKAFADKYPTLAKKYTDAIIKATKWVEENPEEAAQIQIDQEYVSGDPAFNAELLKSYSLKPSISGGESALADTFKDMKTIGLVGADVDAEKLAKDSCKDFSNA
jgi:NitT/TauT family transport system substrate-binding protein